MNVRHCFGETCYNPLSARYQQLFVRLRSAIVISIVMSTVMKRTRRDFPLDPTAPGKAGMEVRATNVTAVTHKVGPEARWRRNGHRGGVLWLTGLSGSGKSTLAIEAERRLFDKGYQVYVLDGDNLRHGLNADLGFSPSHRDENIRRVGEVAALFAEAGFVVIAAFISPYRADRARARAAANANANANAAANACLAGGFHEIHVKADLATCESRDPKGLYRKARAGEIPDFTGISAPYEAPEAPELVVDTAACDVERSVAMVLDYVDDAFPL